MAAENTVGLLMSIYSFYLSFMARSAAEPPSPSRPTTAAARLPLSLLSLLSSAPPQPLPLQVPLPLFLCSCLAQREKTLFVAAQGVVSALPPTSVAHTLLQQQSIAAPLVTTASPTFTPALPAFPAAAASFGSALSLFASVPPPGAARVSWLCLRRCLASRSGRC